MKKERPYIRSHYRQNEYLREKPRFRIVKIDRNGNRRQLTVSITHPDLLPEVERAFLLEPVTAPDAPEIQTELPI